MKDLGSLFVHKPTRRYSGGCACVNHARSTKTALRTLCKLVAQVLPFAFWSDLVGSLDCTGWQLKKAILLKDALPHPRDPHNTIWPTLSCPDTAWNESAKTPVIMKINLKQPCCDEYAPCLLSASAALQKSSKGSFQKKLAEKRSSVGTSVKKQAA